MAAAQAGPPIRLRQSSGVGHKRGSDEARLSALPVSATGHSSRCRIGLIYRPSSPRINWGLHAEPLPFAALLATDPKRAVTDRSPLREAGLLEGRRRRRKLAFQAAHCGESTHQAAVHGTGTANLAFSGTSARILRFRRPRRRLEDA